MKPSTGGIAKVTAERGRITAVMGFCTHTVARRRRCVVIVVWMGGQEKVA